MLGLEVPRDVAPVARLLVPVEVAHAAAQHAYDGARAGALRHVGINALFLDPGRSGGPETYLRELVRALVEEAPERALRRRHDAPRRARRCARRLAPSASSWSRCPADEGERVRRQVAEQLLLPRLARAAPLRRAAQPRERRADRGARAARDHAARRDVLHAAHVRPGHDVRDAHDRRAGGAPRRRAADRLGRGARRDLRGARLRARAVRGRAARARARARRRRRRGPRDGPRASTGSTASGWSCASPPSARTRTRRCSCAPRRCSAQRTDVVLAGHPEAYDAELRRIARETPALRARALRRLRARRGAGGAVGAGRLRRLPDARARASGCRSSRRWTAAWPSRAATSRCCARSAARFRATSIRTTRRGWRRPSRRRSASAPSGVPRGRERAAGYSWAEAARGTLEAYARARHAVAA